MTKHNDYESQDYETRSEDDASIAEILIGGPGTISIETADRQARRLGFSSATDPSLPVTYNPKSGRFERKSPTPKSKIPAGAPIKGNWGNIGVWRQKEASKIGGFKGGRIVR